MNGYSLGLAASPLIVGTIVAAACGVAIWSYRRTSPPISTRRRWALIILRTIGVGLLLLLLFEPVLSFVGLSAEPPSIIVAVDGSASMNLAGLDSARRREARAIVRRLEKSPLALGASWTTFGDSTSPLVLPLPGDTLRADQLVTRLNAPFAAAAERLRTANVRAMVLVTDGRYTAGSNPLFEAERLGMPVYVVGMGDTVEPRDLSVQSILTNEIAYVGTEVPVEVRVKSHGYATAPVSVTLRANGSAVSTQSVDVGKNGEGTAMFYYRPARDGAVRLRAEVAADRMELTRLNNSRTTFVTVKPNRRRYVMVAGGPNADVAFIRRHLAANPDIEVESFIGRGDGRFIEGELTPSALEDAEAIIMIDFPTVQTPDGPLNILREAAAVRGKPLFLVAGSRLDPGRLKILESLLPVTLPSTEAVPQTRREWESIAELTETGQSSPITRLGRPEAWSDLPPLFRSDIRFQARAESEVLLTGRIVGSSVAQPLVVARRLGRNRSVAVLGYGIFRWELLAEGTRVLRGDSADAVLETFVTNALRWLAVADDRRRVRITSEKPLYSRSERIRIVGQVYNESYDPVDNAEVVAQIRGSERERTVTLSPTGTGRYEAIVGELPTGEYVVEGRASLGERFLGRDASGFSVGDIGPEFREPTMHAGLLQALAARTGGRFYTSRTVSTLIDDIRHNTGFSPRTLEHRSDTPLWGLPWILAAALLSFSLEWLIRKRSGMA